MEEVKVYVDCLDGDSRGDLVRCSDCGELMLIQISGTACGECESCLSFNGNPDIIEIDAASNNGVEEIRELINNVKIMKTGFLHSAAT